MHEGSPAVADTKQSEVLRHNTSSAHFMVLHCHNSSSSHLGTSSCPLGPIVLSIDTEGKSRLKVLTTSVTLVRNLGQFPPSTLPWRPDGRRFRKRQSRYLTSVVTLESATVC